MTDTNGKVLRSYCAPAGFLLADYCMSLNKVDIVEMSCKDNALIVTCYDSRKEFYEIHTGTDRKETEKNVQ